MIEIAQEPRIENDIQKTLQTLKDEVIKSKNASSEVHESIEKPRIIERATWDDKWSQIKEQYLKQKLWETFTVEINGKTYTKTADILPYFDANLTYENLKDAYKRIIVHHSDTAAQGTAEEQAKVIRDLEIWDRGFNDISYHFIIASDGTILEWRPLGRVWAHAGETKEANDAATKALPGGTPDIAKATGDEYKKKLLSYVDAMKKDPDYGSVGICLVGNFESNSWPTTEQQAALTKLLNRLKWSYDIPSDNIIFHKEVKTKVVEASGLTLISPVTVCPWKSFTEAEFKTIKTTLDKDSDQAKKKSILLN